MMIVVGTPNVYRNVVIFLFMTKIYNYFVDCGILWRFDGYKMILIDKPSDSH